MIPEGTKIYIRHYRYADKSSRYFKDYSTRGLVAAKDIRAAKQEGTFIDPLPNGGKTEARIILPDGREATAESNCSLKDNFNKTIGRDIAVGRALKQLGIKYNGSKSTTKS